MTEDNCIERGAILLSLLLIGLAACLLLGACTRTVYVPQRTVETVYQHQTDTIGRTDSIIRERETIIMQLDSQAMAAYGIRLAQAERAWMVRERELNEHLRALMESHTDTIIRQDTITVPMPVDRDLTRMERIYMEAGRVAVPLATGAVAAIAFAAFVRYRRKH